MIGKTYNVGIYCRLSNDDERDGESVIIVNQELIFRGWINHLIHLTAAHLWQNNCG